MKQRTKQAKNSTTAFTVRLPVDLVRRVRIRAASTGHRIQDVVREAIEAHVPAARVVGS